MAEVALGLLVFFLMANRRQGGIGAVTMLTSKENRYFEMNCETFIGKDKKQDEIFTYPLLDFSYR